MPGSNRFSGLAMPLVSITRLRVRSFRYLPIFFVYSLRAARQAKSAPGNLAVSLLRDSNFTFWTRTLWANERAMRDFMVSGTHRGLMPRLPRVRRGCCRALDSRITGAAVLAGGPSAYAKRRPAFTGGPSVSSASSL